MFVMIPSLLPHDPLSSFLGSLSDDYFRDRALESSPRRTQAHSLCWACQSCCSGSTGSPHSGSLVLQAFLPPSLACSIFAHHALFPQISCPKLVPSSKAYFQCIPVISFTTNEKESLQGFLLLMSVAKAQNPINPKVKRRSWKKQSAQTSSWERASLSLTSTVLHCVCGPSLAIFTIWYMETARLTELCGRSMIKIPLFPVYRHLNVYKCIIDWEGFHFSCIKFTSSAYCHLSSWTSRVQYSSE